MSQFVYMFSEGHRGMTSLLGGKGANLAEMTNAGLPVPPGFIVTTEACNAFYANDRQAPDGLWDEVRAAMERLEVETGKTFGGGGENPLLVSVRSGSPVSMPGMMDTILNLGLTDETTEALARLTGDGPFAWEAYRRFIRMFSDIVFGIPGHPMDEALEKAKTLNGTLDEAALRAVVARMKRIVDGFVSQEIPDDPFEQLRLSIQAVFNSWGNKRAVDYRNHAGIPHDLGTAVNVQLMVFGNLGEGSATGVAFTRNPATGERGLYGEYLLDAQGEDIVAGVRTPNPIAAMADELPGPHADLLAYAKRLEDHYLDMQDLEFTVEGGTLYMLQTRRGKRTGRAAVRIAVDMVEEGMIDGAEAVRRVLPAQLEQLLHPVVDPAAEVEVLTAGLNASPGAASGIVVFEANEAERLVEEGKQVVLIRHETSPDDFHGMAVASAIVTSRGGVTSHAAVVARGMGKCCVVGCEGLEVNYVKQLAKAGSTTIHAGDWVTVDGNKGEVLLGQVPTIDPEFDDHLETLMGWADGLRSLGVRTNADTPEDATIARRFGAQGIGLCRTEHMFFAADRIAAMRRMIMSPTPGARVEALAELEPMQIEDFEGIFEAMDGYPVTIRLLDPPLHEFLPHHSEILQQLTDLKLQLKEVDSLEAMDSLLDRITEADTVLEQVERLSETNPMLGHRGCRLGITYPEVTEMQVRAIFVAAVRCIERGVTVQPEVMIPLVGFASEFERQADIVRRVATEVLGQAGIELDYKVGTMIELPRAALTAGEIAHTAEFFSFGTNDLTQTTLGMSRDDSAKFLSTYIKSGLIEGDPFQSIDQRGVGQLLQIGVERGRTTRPDLKVGICGEHGGDPASIAFVNGLGLDYVSCSPYRVPVARLAAAHAALEAAN